MFCRLCRGRVGAAAVWAGSLPVFYPVYVSDNLFRGHVTPDEHEYYPGAGAGGYWDGIFVYRILPVCRWCCLHVDSIASLGKSDTGLFLADTDSAADSASDLADAFGYVEAERTGVLGDA